MVTVSWIASKSLICICILVSFVFALWCLTPL